MNTFELDTVAGFDYAKAFSRNTGLISEGEQLTLRRAHAVIIGLGGTGSAQAQALARLGIGHFTLCDPDTFELGNFNRQLGATLPACGRKKAAVTRDIIHSINPEAHIRTVESGLSRDSLDAVLQDADIVLDSLDFYCFNERLLLYPEARRRGLWIINSAPPGFGASLLVFDPAGMRFEDYFGFHPDMLPDEMTVAMAIGVTPSLFFMKYLDKQTLRSDSPGRGWPCVSPAFFLVAGLAATEAANLLLGKRRPYPAPWVLEFDALRQRFKKRFYPFGMKGPLQRFKRALVLGTLRRNAAAAKDREVPS